VGIIALLLTYSFALVFFIIVCKARKERISRRLSLVFLLAFAILLFWYTCLAAYVFAFRYLGKAGVNTLPFARQVALFIIRKILFELCRVFPLMPAIIVAGFWPQNISDMVRRRLDTAIALCVFIH
jgi:hypothetical protein